MTAISAKVSKSRSASHVRSSLETAKAKVKAKAKVRAKTAKFYAGESLVSEFKNWANPSLPLTDLVHKGLPVELLTRMEHAFPGVARKIIPRSTFAAVKKKSRRLPSENSDRLYQAGKVLDFAVQVYGDEQLARDFLSRRHSMLNDRTPLDVAIESGAGADLVINILGRGAYGGGA